MPNLHPTLRKKFLYNNNYVLQFLSIVLFHISQFSRRPLSPTIRFDSTAICVMQSSINYIGDKRILDLLIMNSIRIIMFIFYFLNYVSFKHYSLSEVQKLI